MLSDIWIMLPIQDVFCNFSRAIKWCCLIMPSDARLYNRRTVVHKFDLIDKASKDKVMTGSTSGINILLQLTSKWRVGAQFCWLSCWATTPRFDEGDFLWQNVPATLEWRSVSVISGLAWYVDVKQRWWWIGAEFNWIQWDTCLRIAW